MDLVFVSNEDLPGRAPGAGRPAVIDPLVEAYTAHAAKNPGANLKITGLVSANSLGSFRKRHPNVRFFKQSGDIFIGAPKVKTAKKVVASTAKPAARTSRARSSRSSAKATA